MKVKYSMLQTKNLKVKDISKHIKQIFIKPVRLNVLYWFAPSNQFIYR